MRSTLTAAILALGLAAGCTSLPVPVCEVPLLDAPCDSGYALCVPLHDDWIVRGTSGPSHRVAVVVTPVGSDLVYDQIPRCDHDLFAVCPDHAETGEETRAVCVSSSDFCSGCI